MHEIFCLIAECQPVWLLVECSGALLVLIFNCYNQVSELVFSATLSLWHVDLIFRICSSAGATSSLKTL